MATDFLCSVSIHTTRSCGIFRSRALNILLLKEALAVGLRWVGGIGLGIAVFDERDCNRDCIKLSGASRLQSRRHALPLYFLIELEC